MEAVSSPTLSDNFYLTASTFSLSHCSWVHFNKVLQLLTLSMIYCSVDSLDDVVWSQVLAANSLRALTSLTLDQCHSVSGDSLHDLVTEENDLQLLNIWSCRFVTTKHRETFRKIIARENYDLSMRYDILWIRMHHIDDHFIITSRILPFAGFSTLARPPFEEDVDLSDFEELYVQ